MISDKGSIFFRNIQFIRVFSAKWPLGIRGIFRAENIIVDNDAIIVNIREKTIVFLKKAAITIIVLILQARVIKVIVICIGG